MPRLSIITINYNNCRGLEKTIASVLLQTYPDIEFVVIDGGSTDGSVDVIKKYANKISFWVSEKDKGIYNAQNKGWQNATGKYCLFLNSGDYLVDTNTIQSIFSNEFTEDLVYGDLMVDNGKDPLYTIEQPDPFLFEDIIRSTMFHPATFIKRKLLEARGGYDESFRIVGDYDFFLEMLFVKNCSRKYIHLPVAVFNTEGIGSNPAHKKAQDEERLRSQLRYFSKKEIEATRKIANKKLPKSVRVKNSVGHIPVVREVASFSIYLWQRIRKLFR